MQLLTVSSSPHITKKGNTTRRIMLDVLIALSPALVASIVLFGFHVLLNAIVCMAACFAAELLFSLIKSKRFDKEAVKKSSAWDFSSLVTGLLLALNLPSKTIVKAWNFNFYQNGFDINSIGAANNIIFSFDTVLVCIIGSIFAMVLVKMMFGGIGKNFANPAAAARVFILLSFGLSVVNTLGIGLDASTGATWLTSSETVGGGMFLQYFLGNRGTAAVGETCMIAIILGYIYLCVRKLIDYRIPLILVGSAVVFAFIFDGAFRGNAGEMFGATLAHILSGGLVFGAVFMATDYSSTPNTFIGHAIFAVGVALFTVLIRVFTGMPEGMSFALLIMNVASPLIDKYIYPKPFGYVKQKKEKTPKNKAEGGAKA